MAQFQSEHKMHELAMTREKYLRIMAERKRPLDDHITPHQNSRTTHGTRTA